MTASSFTPSIADRFRNQHVLLTGATGFLAKAILEKILRAVPQVGGVHLLVRPRQTATAAERVEREVLASSIFNRLRETLGESFDAFMQSKLSTVAGDLSEERLGLGSAEYGELATTITCVINSAAACSFGEQLDHALQVNTLGPHRVLEFAKDAGNVPFLHVSTCYVNGEREGDIPEDVLPLGHTVTTFLKGSKPRHNLDADVSSMLARCADIRTAVAEGERDDEVFDDAFRSIYASDRIERVRQEFADSAVVGLGKRTARLHGWTDTYPFTKALGEQLLVRERGQVPLVILRPAIIESSYDEPVPGWIDGLRMADPVITEVGKGNLPEFVGRSDATLDIVPCDMVANAILAAVPPLGGSDVCRIYQLGTSDRNPLTIDGFSKIVYEAYTRRPALDRRGRPMRAALCRWIPASDFKAKLYRRIRHLRLVRDLYTRLGWKDRARRANLKLRVMGRSRDLADLYGFYTSRGPRFLSHNIRELIEGMCSADRTQFPFDVTRIDWREYIVERHVPGLHRMTGARNGSKQVMHGRTLSRIANVSNVFDLFERIAQIYGESTATQVCRGTPAGPWVRYSFRQLVDAAAHVHMQLTSHGLDAGDRVIIYSESNPEWAIAYLGAQRAGLVAVPLDPTLTSGEVAATVDRTGAKLILAGRNAHPTLTGNGSNGHHPTIVRLEEPFVPGPTGLPTTEGRGAPPKRQRGSEDPASIIIENGSIGAVEEIVLSHGDCITHIRALLKESQTEPADGTLTMPRMHDERDFSRRFVLTLATGACVSYIDALD